MYAPPTGFSFAVSSVTCSALSKFGLVCAAGFVGVPVSAELALSSAGAAELNCRRREAIDHECFDMMIAVDGDGADEMIVRVGDEQFPGGIGNSTRLVERRGRPGFPVASSCPASPEPAMVIAGGFSGSIALILLLYVSARYIVPSWNAMPSGCWNRTAGPTPSTSPNVKSRFVGKSAVPITVCTSQSAARQWHGPESSFLHYRLRTATCRRSPARSAGRTRRNLRHTALAATAAHRRCLRASFPRTGRSPTDCSGIFQI